MRWLIAEDSLESRAGHWFEYLRGFAQELPAIGDEITLLVSSRAEASVRTELNGMAVLPEGIFKQLSRPAPLGTRLARIPAFAIRTARSVRPYLDKDCAPDVVFVPTVTLYHLVAWSLLVKGRRWPSKTRLLLFFPGLPIRLDASQAQLDGSPTSRLFRFVLGRLAPEIRRGRVVLGVETQAMQRAAEALFGVPICYLPHPVAVPLLGRSDIAEPPITFGAYGPARYEKGGDVLVAAIDHLLAKQPSSSPTFGLQWIDDFSAPDGRRCQIPASVQSHPRVEVIRRIFAAGEYERYLARTAALVLPYRPSSYNLRVSRMAIEGLVRGLPMVVSRNTTLADQTAQFGAGLECNASDPDSLADTLCSAANQLPTLQAAASSRARLAQQHFSVQTFRSLLIEHGLRMAS